MPARRKFRRAFLLLNLTIISQLHNYFRMDIQKKIVAIVTASILLTVVPGAWLMYNFAEHRMLEAASEKLNQMTAGFAGVAMQRFSQGEPKLKALARILEKELAQPEQPQELLAFKQTLQLNPDGVWRNRQPGFDGLNESGVFLPASAALSDAQKVWHLRIKKTLDTFGAAASQPLENVWYLSPQRSEIIFDRAYPEFAFEQKADNDYTQTPWVTGTSPTLNPQRVFTFTPPLFDPVPKVWMVSAIYPLYVGGQWIGSLGEDMQLTSVLEASFKTGQFFQGSQHLLLDKAGNFVLAGPWQKQLEANPAAFRSSLSQEQQLLELMKLPLADAPRTLSTEIMVQGKRQLVVGMQLAPLGWSYYRLVPVDEIMAMTRQLFLAMGAMIFLTTAFAGLLIMGVGRNITRRIQRLRDVMQGYSRDNTLRVLNPQVGHDEISEVSLVYNHMADDFDRVIAERREIQLNLSKSEELWRFALEGAGDGVWDWDVRENTVFFSQRCKEMLGFKDDEIGNHPQEWVSRVHPEDQPAALAAMRDCLRGKSQIYISEHRVLNKEGRYQWTLDRARVVSRSAEGKPLRMIGTHTDITERKNAEVNLAESETRLRTIIQAEPECIKIVDAQGHLVQMNPAGLAMVEADSWEQVAGCQVLDVIAPEYREAFSEMHQRVMAGESVELEFEVLGLKGGRRWLATHAVPMLDTGGMVQLAITRDITARKQAEENLHLAASVFTHAREGIMITTADGSIVDVNDAFVRITGFSREDVLGQNPRIFNSGRQSHAYYAAMWDDLLRLGHWYGEIWNRRKNGEVYAQMQTLSAVRDAQGRIKHFVSLFSDITALKEHQQQLEHIAHYDALTNLPNRVLLADRLRQGLAQAQRRSQLLAVAYLDLDGFKAINDRHGHEAGDQLLIALSDRMRQALREGDTLARIGGEEFVAVLVDLMDATDCVPMLTRLLAAAAQPVQCGELVLQVSASLGVTFYPQSDNVDADLLLRQADQAMYQAKLAGKNRYHFFDAEQDRSVRGHHESVEHIRQALAAHELVLYYQPKVNMRTGKIIGAEALIRWQHPVNGLLLPAVFLPVIEDHPLAVDIGDWVIDTALTQMELWHAVGLDIPVSVNVGARQLQQSDFVARLRTQLAAHPQIKPGCLELEVLETSALEDLVHVSQTMAACREIGVRFALDDFGTGYSSLTYLKRLPVALLKIDQSFVRDMLDDPDDMAILEGVIGLASAFRREVIAEGVETVAHGEMLLQLGCELAQGYGIARPMPAHALPQWAKTWRPDPMWVDIAPLSRADLPLLFASAEHRAWIVGIEDFLRGNREAPSSLSLHQCRFGTWLESRGLVRYGAQAEFSALKPLHQKIHTLADSMCQLNARGLNTQALAFLPELHQLRDALLEKMKALSQKNRLSEPVQTEPQSVEMSQES